MSAQHSCGTCQHPASFYWHDAGPFGAGTFYGCVEHAPADAEALVARAEQTGHGHTFGPGFGSTWTCSVSQLGTGFHVAPTREMTVMGNWALNPYHRKGVGNFFAQLWRVFSGAYIRREYPKNERGLRRAIVECEAFCERENAQERNASAVLARMRSAEAGS